MKYSVSRHNVIWKWGMYLLSMMLFALIVLILSFPFEIHLGDNWEFVGWNSIWNWMWWFPLIFILIIIIDVVFYCYFKYFSLSGTRYISVEIKEIESLQGDILAFLASYFIPLVSFTVTKTNHQLVLLILFGVIGLLYVNGNLYYQNPTLSLMGFKTYRVSCNLSVDEKLKKRNVLCMSNLVAGDRIKYIPLSDDVWFAVKK